MNFISRGDVVALKMQQDIFECNGISIYVERLDGLSQVFLVHLRSFDLVQKVLCKVRRCLLMLTCRFFITFIVG